MQLAEVEPSSPVKIRSDLLVSVVIDNYNYGQYLSAAIESVLAQSYPNLELIVVDDGSTDNSRAVIESYGDRLTKLYQANAGQRAALIAGLSHAKGDIVCFLDSDDAFYPHKIERVVAAFEQHPDWLQISHRWTVVDRQGQKIGSSVSNVLSQGDVRLLLLRWGKYASGITSSLAFRRAALDHIALTSGSFGMDSFLVATVPFHGLVGCINEPLMYYRTHGQNFRAYSDNLPQLMAEHQAIADYINQAAAAKNLTERFDLRRDVDYRVYKAMQRGKFALLDALQVIGLSLRESFAIRRSAKDTLIRLCNRSIAVLWPHQGCLLLRYGLRGYVRFKFWRKRPTR
jgi:glycosyltransferase involved in cell wall biosynthesis